MYEFPWKTKESLDLIKLDKTKSIYDLLSYFQFQTDFFFSYFWKTTTDSVFHNVEKQVGQKWPFSVVKGLSYLRGVS